MKRERTFTIPIQKGVLKHVGNSRLWVGSFELVATRMEMSLLGKVITQ